MSVNPEIAAQLEPQVSVDDVLLKFAKVVLERDWYKERLAQVMAANQTLTSAMRAPAPMPTPIGPLTDDAFAEEHPPAVVAAGAAPKNGKA